MQLAFWIIFGKIFTLEFWNNFWNFIPLEFWILLWKIVFILGVGLFALLAVVVTIGGAIDIRNLFRVLHEEHARNTAAAEADQSENDAP